MITVGRARGPDVEPFVMRNPDMGGLRYILRGNAATARDDAVVTTLSDEEIRRAEGTSLRQLIARRYKAHLTQRTLALRAGWWDVLVAQYESRVVDIDVVARLRWLLVCDFALEELEEWKALAPRVARKRAQYNAHTVARLLRINTKQLARFESCFSDKTGHLLSTSTIRMAQTESYNGLTFDQVRTELAALCRDRAYRLAHDASKDDYVDDDLY